MINICLTKFTDDPWSAVIMKVFLRALKELDAFCTVEEIFGYPMKYYDLIILVGIRSIVKRNLNKSKITNYCKKIIDMGDDSMDPRRNCEDIYFYFNPSSKKLHEHYQYLPKFILEEYLYPEYRNDNDLNIYIDHFKYQNISEREQSINAIEKIFRDIRNSNVKMNVFYHTSKGIEINRLDPEIPKMGVPLCASFIPFEEISYYYRMTDVFFPTHRETQGMVAQEIGACGGITVLQDWMYPKTTHNQFPCIVYYQNQKIDFKKIENISRRNSKKDIRAKVIETCGFDNFKKKLHSIIVDLFN